MKARIFPFSPIGILIIKLLNICRVLRCRTISGPEQRLPELPSRYVELFRQHIFLVHIVSFRKRGDLWPGNITKFLYLE